MVDSILPGMSSQTFSPQAVTLEAEPESLEIDLQRTVIMVIDMQNVFAAKGGLFDVHGMDISPCRKTIAPIEKITNMARSKEVTVIYTVHTYSPDMYDTGGPSSPNWWKEPTLVMCRKYPEHADKGCFRNTWGCEIIDELKPRKGDVIIEKNKYSGFTGTNLDNILKAHNAKYLIFTGLTTNVCVESTLRDAYFLEYWPIIVSDACALIGPPSVHDATLSTIRIAFGWVTNTKNILKALAG